MSSRTRACAVLGFHAVTEAQRRTLVRAINAELSRTSDRQRLLQFARRWLGDRKQSIPREPELRAYIAKAIRQREATLVREIVEAIDIKRLARWMITITQPREDGDTVQSWQWAPPAKHSTRQIDQVLECIELLTSLKVDQHLAELPESIVRRYARRLASRAPAVAAAEVGTLLNLRRALRNGSVWIDHSLSFESRETLFILAARWQQTRRAHYRRLHLPQDPVAFLEPLIERAQAGVLAVSTTAAAGILRVDDELHLTPLEPLADDRKVTKLSCRNSFWPSTPRFASAGSCWGKSRDPVKSC